MKTDKKHVSCPHCGKKNTWSKENIYKPFCSERCKLIDLGEWASEKYLVEGESVDLDESKNDEET